MHSLNLAKNFYFYLVTSLLFGLTTPSQGSGLSCPKSQNLPAIGHLLESAYVRMIDSGHEPTAFIDQTPDIYRVDGKKLRPGDRYERSFEELIQSIGISDSEEYFPRLLKEFKRRSLSTNVLDLFGSGLFLTDSRKADSITGLRFEPLDYSRAGLKKSDMPSQIIGDITHPNTWAGLDKRMKENGSDHNETLCGLVRCPLDGPERIRKAE